MSDSTFIVTGYNYQKLWDALDDVIGAAKVREGHDDMVSVFQVLSKVQAHQCSDDGDCDIVEDICTIAAAREMMERISGVAVMALQFAGSALMDICISRDMDLEQIDAHGINLVHIRELMNERISEVMTPLAVRRNMLAKENKEAAAEAEKEHRRKETMQWMKEAEKR